MSVFLITGLPATGKSTVCAELNARGFKAYDGDTDYLAWCFDKNGRPVLIPDEERTIEFLRSHTRKLPRETVAAFANEFKDKPVFICNDPDNEDELQDMFDKIFALIIDIDTMKRRLADRTTNIWGKLPHELQFTLDDVDHRLGMYDRYSYVKIDSTQPVKDVADRILQEAGL